MAQIVFGAGVSHSPLLALDGHAWFERSRGDIKSKTLNLSDGRRVSYEALLAEVGPRHAHAATEVVFERQAAAAQAALNRMAADLAAAEPDVVVVVGDDQEELFGPENQPGIAIFYGEDIATQGRNAHPEFGPWFEGVRQGYAMDKVHRLPGHRAFALSLIQGLVDRDVDVAVCAKVVDPEQAGFGHAFGFISKRLFNGRAIPMVPILLNTYYPPNVPSPRRCVEVGKKVAEVIAKTPQSLRVAVIASGGLSHFVTDEALDRGVLDALVRGDLAALSEVPRPALASGSSEILNWILMGGAIQGLQHRWSVYEPVYRTPAGTGIGLAFSAWF